jgi:hypothetical protein
MIRIRNHRFSKLMAIFTGIVFLNMGFFLTEVRMLALDHCALVENIIKMVSTMGCEEEKDAFGESAKTDSSSQSVDFCIVIYPHNSDHTFLIADDIHKSQQFKLLSHIPGEIPTPPPWIG